MIAFEKIPDEYKNIGEQWAIAKAEYEFLDEERKTVLARMASKYEGAESMRERMARQEYEYINHLKAVQEARELYLKYETLLHAYDMRFSWYQSTKATERVEAKLI